MMPIADKEKWREDYRAATDLLERIAARNWRP